MLRGQKGAWLMSIVYTVKEVAELFQISTSAVYQLRDELKLHQLPDVPGVRFSKEEVHALAEYSAEFTATRYAELVAENEKLKRELSELKMSIRTATAGMLQLMEV